MTIILIRTFLFYIFLTALMRFMGKRQIGEVQLSEFVAVIMLSEIAALPIADRNVPLLYGILPLALITSIEIVNSFFCRKSKTWRKIIDGSPVVLVLDGKVIDKNLTKTRITMDEIESEMRISGYTNIKQIKSIILEQTGKMSIMPFSKYKRNDEQ